MMLRARIMGVGLLWQFVFCCFDAHGWGQTGHRVIGGIADSLLSPAALKMRQELLGRQTLAQVSTWADEIRSENWAGIYDAYHYINAPEEQKESAAINWEKIKGKHLLSGIELFTAQLNNQQLPKEKRVFALKFLAHLIGDLHQPLHLGYRSDLGGNKIKLLWFGVPSNLHRVWDTGLIDSRQLSYTEYQDFLRADFDSISAASGKHVLALVSGKGAVGRPLRLQVFDWANAVRNLVPPVYLFGKEGRALSYGYLSKNSKTVDRQLADAGLHLAQFLNQLAAGGVY